MLIVVLVVLCVASLAAAELQTMRLRTLQQKMDALRQNVEHEVRKQEALWHDMVHDLRNPAACIRWPSSSRKTATATRSS